MTVLQLRNILNKMIMEDLGDYICTVDHDGDACILNSIVQDDDFGEVYLSGMVYKNFPNGKNIR